MHEPSPPAKGLLGLPSTVEGIVLMLASALIFSVGNAVLKHLAATVPPIEVVFFRSFLSLLFLSPLIWWAGGFSSLKTGRLKLHITRSLLQTVSMIMFFQGIVTVPLVQVNALEFTSPIFATVFAIFLLGDRIHFRRTAALVAGFAGAIVALWPDLQRSGISGLGSGQVLLLGASLVWGLVLVTIRELGKTESPLVQSFYLGLVLTPITGVWAALVWVWPSWNELFWLLIVASTATFGSLAYIQAFRLADMSVCLPIDFSKLIWSALLGFLVFSEVPEVLTVVGATIIFAAGAYITLREARVARRDARHERTLEDESPA
jgi:drug/metabolite transporter (DMT)-like permease